MRAALAALALLQAQPPSPPQAPPPLRNWSFQRKEINPRTGQEEVTTVLRGEEAIPIDIPKKIFEVRGVVAAYYTEAKPATEARPASESETLLIKAGRGRYDDPAKQLDLSGGVRVEREKDGTVLTALEGSMNLGTQRMDVEKGVELRGPAGNLTGEKVTSAGLDLREITVERRGFLEMMGRARELARPPAGPPRPPEILVTQVYSRGPLVLHEPKDRNLPVLVTARGGVRLDRMDLTGTVRLDAETLEITAFRRLDPATGRTEIQPERLVATGPLAFWGTSFADGADFSGTADRLTWRIDDHADWVEDLLELAGSPVVLRNGPYRIESPRARIERLEGRATFEDEVAAQLASGEGPEAKPLNLRCGKLVARSAPGARAFQEIEATRNVVLEEAGERAGRAEADRFVMDLVTERGVLEGRPFVRVTQESSVIRAPRVVREGRSIVVLKGPKRIRLLQKAEDGKETEYRVTAEGDVELDSSGERTVIRMRDRCSVRSQDFHVLSERIDVRMSRDGKEMESLRASGGVRATQATDGSTIYGERLDYDPRTQELRLVGRPEAVVEARGSLIVQEKLLIAWETDPRTGQKVRYTHMLGGRQPVRLILDDRPK